MIILMLNHTLFPFVQYIMNESEADVHPINTQITEEVDAEDLSIATYESEKNKLC